MKKPRWKRIPLDVIRNNANLLSEMMEKRKSNAMAWRYFCGDQIKWKNVKST